MGQSNPTSTVFVRQGRGQYNDLIPRMALYSWQERLQGAEKRLPLQHEAPDPRHGVLGRTGLRKSKPRAAIPRRIGAANPARSDRVLFLSGSLYQKADGPTTRAISTKRGTWTRPTRRSQRLAIVELANTRQPSKVYLRYINGAGRRRGYLGLRIAGNRAARAALQAANQAMALDARAGLGPAYARASLRNRDKACESAAPIFRVLPAVEARRRSLPTSAATK